MTWGGSYDSVPDLAWQYSRGSQHQHEFFAMRYLAWAHEVSPFEVTSLEYALVALFSDLYQMQ